MIVDVYFRPEGTSVQIRLAPPNEIKIGTK